MTLRRMELRDDNNNHHHHHHGHNSQFQTIKSWTIASIFLQVLIAGGIVAVIIFFIQAFALFNSIPFLATSAAKKPPVTYIIRTPAPKTSNVATVTTTPHKKSTWDHKQLPTIIRQLISRRKVESYSKKSTTQSKIMQIPPEGAVKIDEGTYYLSTRVVKGVRYHGIMKLLTLDTVKSSGSSTSRMTSPPVNVTIQKASCPPAYLFPSGNSKWLAENTPWNIDPSNPFGWSAPEVIDPIISGMAKWNAAIPCYTPFGVLDPSILIDGPNVGPPELPPNDQPDFKNEIVFLPLSDPSTLGATITWAADDPSIGIVEADLIFNTMSSAPFSLDAPLGPPGVVDYPTIVLHELGHWIGLAHTPNDIPTCGDSVMFPSAQPNVAKRDLTPPDATVISELYGCQVSNVTDDCPPGEFCQPPCQGTCDPGQQCQIPDTCSLPGQQCQTPDTCSTPGLQCIDPLTCGGGCDPGQQCQVPDTCSSPGQQCQTPNTCLTPGQQCQAPDTCSMQGYACRPEPTNGGGECPALNNNLLYIIICILAGLGALILCVAILYQHKLSNCPPQCDSCLKHHHQGSRCLAEVN